MSTGSKSSMSPTESRVLSEQSEKTLDSDSKLSNSLHSKLLQSPPNSSHQNGEDPETTTSSGKIKDGETDTEISDKSKNGNSENTQKAQSSRIRSAHQDIFAEQDMFSEHFDVSLDI